MSSQFSPALPPPIIDRVSGKTFIAIPAPAFVTTQISDTESLQSNFVYVESKTPSLTRMFTPERSGILCTKRPVHQWMDDVRLSYPPPDHTPWIGQVEPESESLTEEVPLFSASDQKRRSTDSPRLSMRSSCSDFPSFSSGSSLLRASLPSFSSSVSSEFYVPNFWEAKATMELNASTTTALTVRQRSSQSNQQSARSSGASCVKEVKIRKIPRKVDDSLTLVDAVVEKPQEVATGMERLDDLDTFLSNGLRKMDSTLRRLTLHRQELEPPLLVVSTSQAAMPVSLESTADIHRVSSIAQRRGKALGPLKLDQQNTFSELDYPSVPTAFRGSPMPEVLAFPVPPTVVSRQKPSRFTIDQMISSLRAQIKMLETEPTSPNLSCEVDAMEWLETELSQEKEEDAWNGVTKDHVETKEIQEPSSQPVKKSRARSATESASRLSPTTATNLRHIKEGSEDSTPATISRSGLRRATISTSSESAKRVKFSIGPPITIPHDILGKNRRASFRTTGDGAHPSPPKRKPPPALPSPSLTTASGLLSPPPVRFGNRWRTPALSGPPKEPLPPLPKQIKRRASETLMTNKDPIQIDGLYRVRASLDGPRSIRKSKQPMRVVDLLSGKKRAGDENVSRMESTGKKMEKTKLRGRVLPFQNMLNRLRA